jgi:hypothetical protein
MTGKNVWPEVENSFADAKLTFIRTFLQPDIFGGMSEWFVFSGFLGSEKKSESAKRTWRKSRELN